MEDKNGNWHNPKKKDIFGALSLILLGVVFLLNTTGVIGWDFWGNCIMVLLRIWPLYLVVAGLQLIIGKTRFSEIIFGAIYFLIFVAILVLGFLQGRGVNINNMIPFLSTTNISDNENQIVDVDIVDTNEYSINDVINRDLKFNFTSGKFSIVDESDSPNYLVVNSIFYKNFGTPKLTKELENGDLNLSFSSEFTPENFFNWNYWDREVSYMISVGQSSIPTSLDLKLTSGNGTLELSKLDLDDLSIEMTSGTVNAILKKDSVPALTDINLTSGNLNLSISRDFPVEIRYKKTSGSLNIDDTKIEDDSGVYSRDTETNNGKAIINLELTSGSVVINFI